MPGRQSAPTGHQNAYRGGVLSGPHWADRILAEDQTQCGRDGMVQEDSPYVTSNQAAFPPKDRYAVRLNRVDLDKTYECIPREELLCHHNADNSSLTTFLPLNPLTYGTKQKGEPAVQQYLWQAQKKHDFKVPVSRTSAGPDTDTYISAAGKPTGQLIPKRLPGGGNSETEASRESIAYYPRQGGTFTASLNKVHLKTGLRR